jgi:hypothetical protein
MRLHSKTPMAPALDQQLTKWLNPGLMIKITAWYSQGAHSPYQVKSGRSKRIKREVQRGCNVQVCDFPLLALLRGQPFGKGHRGRTFSLMLHSHPKPYTFHAVNPYLNCPPHPLGCALLINHLFLLLFGGTGVWTLARQVLYLLSHSTSP